MPLTQPLAIEKINLGGVADSIYAGTKNSVYRAVGLDLHSEAGIVKVRQKLAKHSGSVIDEFCKVGIETSTGDKYWFSSTSGKIWKEGSPYTLAHTTTPSKGSAACFGAIEYGRFLYWFTEKRGHRIPIGGLSDWATNAQEDVLELNLDQLLGSTGNTYALTTGVNEGATHRQTFVAFNDVIEGFALYVVAKGTGNWTLTLHDSSNNSLGTVAITNGNLTNGAYNIFEFASPVTVTKNATLHVHIHSSVADGTVTSETSNDLEDGLLKIYRVSDSEYHPVIDHFGIIFIGDGHFVHQVEEQADGSHVFTTEALDLYEPYRVKCLGRAPFDLLIGTIISDTISKGRVFRWNTYAESWTVDDEISEVGINAFIPVGHYMFVSAGVGGKLYIYNYGTDKLEPYKKIYGNYTPTAKATIHPNSVGNFNGLALFGVSNVTGNPTDQGVWLLGQATRDYPIVLDLSFPISERSGDDLVLSGIEVGGIIVSGLDIYVAWKNGSNYGVDKLDYSNKLEAAFLESRIMWIDRSEQQNWAKFVSAYRQNPDDTYHYINVKVNHAADWTNLSGLKKDTDRNLWLSDEELQVGNTLQVQIGFVVSGNDAPDFENAAIYLSQ